jgi:thioredoxin-related protein
MKKLKTMLAAAVMILTPWAANSGELVAALDLRADAVEASEKKLPILLLYTASYCHYCATVKADVYFPMNDDPDARARVVLREIQVDSSAPVREFSGSQLNHHEFAKIRGITIVPTLEIVDEQGEPLTEPLVGSGVRDFYGFYVEQGIDKALLEIKTRKNAS